MRANMVHPQRAVNLAPPLPPLAAHEAPRRAHAPHAATYARTFPYNGQQSECDATHADRAQAERHREDNGHTDALVRATDRDMDLLTIIDACTQTVN